MADSIFLEPMKRWFQNRVARRPARSGAEAAVAGADASAQLRSILAEQRAGGTPSAGDLAPSQVITTEYGGANALVCPQCHESYDAGSQFCSKCGCGLSPIDRSLPPLEASSDGIITRVRLESTPSGPSPAGATSQVRLGGSSQGQTGDVVNVTHAIGGQQHSFVESHESDAEEDSRETGSLILPEPVDSMTSNLRSLFTRTSGINQETKDLLERYGTVDVHVLIDELHDLAVTIGARSRRGRR